MAGAGPLPPSKKVLLVEGQDDRHVIHHLCARRQPTPNFEVLDKGGVNNLLSSIGPEIKAPGRNAVGIVVDANDDLTSRWTAVAHRLRRANIDPPDSPCLLGTIIPGSPQVGIWLMPNNQLPGELEDFVKKMIPAGDPVWPMSERYIDAIPEANRKFAAGKTLRAKLYAWLATREIPNRMGLAIGTGDLSTDNELSSAFVDWLQRLFR